MHLRMFYTSEVISMIKAGRSILLVCLWIGASIAARGLDPGVRISQYAHRAWRVQDGAFSGAPNVIAQTKDGYLWIGTEGGLVRFDGVRFAPWIPPNGKRLPDPRITSLLGARDGSLWIGTPDGLARWTGEDLIDSPKVRWRINDFFEERDGSIWLTRSRVNDGSGPLCHAIADQIQCYGKSDGIPVPFANTSAMDRVGNLWIGSAAMLFRWKQGSFKAFPPKGLKKAEALTGVVGIVALPDNSLVIGIERSGPGLGLERIVNDEWQPFTTKEFDGSKLEVTALLVDREDSLWVGTARDGIYRIHENSVDHFRHADGLSGDSINSLLQDAEGTLWIATDRGVDSFHDLPITTFSTAEGLSSDRAGAVASGHDGTIWIANSGGLDFIRNGKVSSIRRENGLPGTRVTALMVDHTGKLWVAIDNGLWTYTNGHFTPVLDGGKPLGTTVQLAEDGDGNTWAGVIGSSQRIVRIQGDRVRETILPTRFEASSFIAAGSSLWINLPSHELGRYQDGQFATFSMKTSHDTGEIRTIFSDVDGAIWGVTRTGLIRRKDGETKSLGPQNGYRCDRTYALIVDAERSLWSYSTCGVLRITRQQLDQWWKNPDATVEMTRFDVFDGAQAAAASFDPRATRSPDGRLWFANDHVVQMVDPSHLKRNTAPPPVQIEAIIGDRKTYGSFVGLHLPALTRDLEIDYTGLSFIAPQKMHFRYILEGHDQSWQDVGTRRQAFYSDLRPGKYRFRVAASNADGVWNESGASVEFSILPAFYQRVWFRVLCVIAGLSFAWFIYRLRLRQVGRAISGRFEERMAERTRLARELHDTLLQTLQGSKLFADTSLRGTPDTMRMRDTIVSLSGWLDRAITEVRASLNSLRTSTSQKDNLGEALLRAAEDCRQSATMQLDFGAVGAVNGTEPEMLPMAREEIYRIGYEAILNACRHSEGSKLEIRLRLLPDFWLSVHDNGKGMDARIAAGGKDGHFGLKGMRERSQRVHGVLTIASNLGGGTKIDLVVPAKIVFPQHRMWTAFLKRVGMFFSASDQTST